MKQRKKAMLAAGILTGMALLSPTLASAAGPTATPGTQTVYLQLTTPRPLALQTYAINGSNYVQLRELGRELDFYVGYLAPQNVVVVDGVSPYQGGGAPTAAATGPAEATPTSQTFNINGRRTTLEAYVIGGHNYVRLRDIGRAMDFSVVYDGTTNSVLIDRTLPYAEEEKQAAAPAGAITSPRPDERFIPRVGDQILCGDGSAYEIRDVSRYARMEPLPPLPTPTCDWSQFPELELPEAKPRRYGEKLFILNAYETRRMQYSLYNLIGANPATSDNGILKRQQSGAPYGRVSLELDETWSCQSFWPWRDASLETVFNSRPVSEFRVQAWDYYLDGKYQHTEYMIQSF